MRSHDASRMDPLTLFIVDLFLLLACAVIAGEIAVHLGQAAMVGQLLVGVVLGPSLLGPYLGLTVSSTFPAGPGLLGVSPLGSLQFLATIFILFMAGLEVTPERIYGMGSRNLALGCVIFVVPLTIGILLSLWTLPWIDPKASFETALLTGLVLAVTALPVMGILLSEFRILQSPLGEALVNAALVNEILAVTLFTIFLRLGPSLLESIVAIIAAVISVGVFLGTIVSVHMGLLLLRRRRHWEWLTDRFSSFWRSKQGAFALLMVLLIGSTLYSQFLGLTYVMGAFFAGVLVTRESAGREAHQSISYIFEVMTWGFFVPIFFAIVGIGVNLRLLATPLGIGVFSMITLVAIVTKVGSGAGMARFLGWGRADAGAIGFLVNARGAVASAMAVILLQSRLIDDTVFSIVVGVAIITTILAPVGALSSWLSSPTSREELFRRIPTLRSRSPSARQLRPPVDWGSTMSPSSATLNLRTWLESQGDESPLPAGTPEAPVRVASMQTETAAERGPEPRGRDYRREPL